MIDSVPNSSLADLATPPVPGNTAIPVPSTSPVAGQESFADTLQSRLKLMAVNKSTVSIKAVGAPSPATLPDLISLLITAPQSAVTEPISALANLAQSMTDAESNSDDASADQIAASTATTSAPASIVPLALNAIAQPAATSHSKATTINDNQPRDLSTFTGDSAAAESAATAILAAVPEKNAPLTANRDADSSSKPFADLLKTAAAPANSAPTSSAATPVVIAALPAKEVSSPVGSPHWADDIGGHLSWMVNQHQSRAELVLNPPQLGRIEVSITMNGDQANATFVSGNPEVRDVLQGSLPRLREVMAEAGVFLGQANVGAESFNQNGNGAEKGGKSPGDSFSSSGDTLLGSTKGLPLPQTSDGIRRGQGLIDLFA